MLPLSIIIFCAERAPMEGMSSPRLGQLLRAWRRRRDMPLPELADCLYRQGFIAYGDANALVAHLTRIEVNDECPFATPYLKAFGDACAACLALGANECHTYADFAARLVLRRMKLQNPPLNPLSEPEE
jgi:hypothetical protein